MLIDRDVTLETERLVLRRFVPGDAPAIARLCADREIALNTISIPHPYTLEDAEQFLDRLENERNEGTKSMFALESRQDGNVLGSISLLRIVPEHRRAELGYTVGVEHWGQGYATEACRAVIRHGFADLELHKIFACYFPRNPASARVLKKLGFVEEGRLRQHLLKWDEWLDKVVMSQLREEWERMEGNVR